jgi:hypothetical protein
MWLPTPATAAYWETLTWLSILLEQQLQQLAWPKSLIGRQVKAIGSFGEGTTIVYV